MTKLLVVSLLLLFGTFAGLGVAGVVAHIRFTPPTQEAIAQPVWIPNGAEVRQSKVVHPGTFKISIPFEELQNTTQPGQPMLVVYNTQDVKSAGATRPSIAYYRSIQDGSGIFHYARVEILPPDKDLPFRESLFTKWEVTSFDEQNHAFQFTLVKDMGPLYASIFVVVVGAFLSLVTIIIVLVGRRRSTPVPISLQ